MLLPGAIIVQVDGNSVALRTPESCTICGNTQVCHDQGHSTHAAGGLCKPAMIIQLSTQPPHVYMYIGTTVLALCAQALSLREFAEKSLENLGKKLRQKTTKNGLREKNRKMF